MRRKTHKNKFSRFHATANQCRNKCRRAGQGHYLNSSGNCTIDDAISRIGYQWRTGVTDKSDNLACLHLLNHRLDLRLLIMLMASYEARRMEVYAAMADAMTRAVACYRDGAAWRPLMLRGMAQAPKAA